MLSNFQPCGVAFEQAEEKAWKLIRIIYNITHYLCWSRFNDTRKVKVLSLPETIKEKSTFRAKALRWKRYGQGLYESKVLHRHVRIVFLPNPPIAILELPNCLSHEWLTF